MKIGIIGAGPAGSLCASQLARLGGRVLLFDPKGVWEKPCGGGVTPKALLRYPFLNDCLDKRRQIRGMTVASPTNAQVQVALDQPLAVYSRTDLNRLILDHATTAGARFVQERALDFRRQNGRWELLTERAVHRLDFLIAADGVNSLVRRKLGVRFAAEDLMITFGYRVPRDMKDVIDIKFFPKFPGYYWAFPRANHISFGICGRMGRHSSQTLKQMLHEFMQRAGHLHDLAGTDSWEVYSALIPSLRPESFRGNHVSGEGWALVGDAAGFADPITCEGIYYALRSGELLSQALAESRPASYATRCQEDFVGDFIHAAELFEKFYAGDFLGSDFITRMVQTASRSRGLRSIMNAFVAGRQDYRSLRANLLRRSPRILFDLAISLLQKPAKSET